jgi:hypothetical protein
VVQPIINVHDEIMMEPYHYTYEVGEFVQTILEPHDIYEIVDRRLSSCDERYVVRRLRDDWHENYWHYQIEPANAMEVLAWVSK